MSSDEKERGTWLASLVFDRDALERIYRSCRSEKRDFGASFHSFLAQFEQSSAHDAEELLSSWLSHGSDHDKLMRRARARLLSMDEVTSIWRPSEHNDVSFKAHNGLNFMTTVSADDFLETLRIVVEDDSLEESSRAKIVLRSRRIDDIQSRLLQQESAEANICKMTGESSSSSRSHDRISQFCRLHPFYLSISRQPRAFELEAYLDDVESLCIKLKVQPQNVVRECYKQYQAIHEWLQTTQLSESDRSSWLGTPRSVTSHDYISQQRLSQTPLLPRHKRKRESPYSVSPVKRAKLHASVSRRGSLGLPADLFSTTASTSATHVDRFGQSANQNTLLSTSDGAMKPHDQSWTTGDTLYENQEHALLMSENDINAAQQQHVEIPESPEARYVNRIEYVQPSDLVMDALRPEAVQRQHDTPRDIASAKDAESLSQIDLALNEHSDTVSDEGSEQVSTSESEEEACEQEEGMLIEQIASLSDEELDNEKRRHPRAVSEENEAQDEEQSWHSPTKARISAIAITAAQDEAETDDEDKAVLPDEMDAHHLQQLEQESESSEDEDVEAKRPNGVASSDLAEQSKEKQPISDRDDEGPESSTSAGASEAASVVQTQPNSDRSQDSESSEDESATSLAKDVQSAAIFDDHIDAASESYESDSGSEIDVQAHPPPEPATTARRRTARDAPPLHKIMRTVMKSMNGEAESASESSSSDESSEASDDEDDDTAIQARQRLEMARPLMKSQHPGGQASATPKSEDEDEQKSSHAEAGRATDATLKGDQSHDSDSNASESDSSSVISGASASFAASTMQP